jgi:hypothetical protein
MSTPRGYSNLSREFVRNSEVEAHKENRLGF